MAQDVTYLTKLPEKKQPVKDHPRRGSHSDTISVKSKQIPVIQCATACACGGGCPRCTTKAVIQPNLTIGMPNDKYEKEADGVASRVLGKPYLNARKQSEKKTGNHAKLDNLGSGRSMPKRVVDYFEPRFGYDFSGVRIHTGCEASKMATGINARAFTYGQDIVFGNNQFAPETDKGKRLLAHELTHIVQPESQIIRRSPDKTHIQSPWDDLPADAKKTLIRSYTILTPYERTLKENWIWNQGGKTAKENYNKLRVNSPMHQQAFLRVYYRMKNVGLWNHVNYLTNISGPDLKKCISRTPEISFIPHDPIKLIVMLFSTKFCRDTQASNIAKNISGIITRKITKVKNLGWREVVPAGSPGLHIFPGRLTEVHIDDKSPVKGRSNKGTCIYSMRHSLTHASYDLWRLGATLYPSVQPPSIAVPESQHRRDVVPLLEWRF